MKFHDDGGNGIVGVCMVIVLALIAAIVLGLLLPTIPAHW